MLLNNIRLLPRLLGGFGIIVALGVGMFAASWWSMQRMLRTAAEQQGGTGQQHLQHLQDTYQTGLLLVGGLLGVGVVLGTALYVAIAKSIVSSTAQVTRAGKAIADGKLDVPMAVKGRDEIADMTQALEVMRRRLGGTIGEIRACAYAVDEASADIDNGTRDLAGRTETLASHLQRMGSDLIRVADAQRLSAEASRDARAFAKQVTDAAASGRTSTASMESGMSSIREQALRIRSIVSVIEGLAFQTNILALNASVESARAGEAGRGFAVVADEVRALSHRSAAASKEIAALIAETETAVEGGVREAGRVSLSVDAIGQLMDALSRRVDEITQSADTQCQTIEQLSRVTTELDASAQSNAALVEQATAATQMLRTTSSRLADQVRPYAIEPVVAPQHGG